MAIPYDRKAFRHGHVVPLSSVATVVTYMPPTRHCYMVVIEFYDDWGVMYAYKKVACEYPTEQKALDAAASLVGEYTRKVDEKSTVRQSYVTK